MAETLMQTIAVCDTCGRGYCYVADEAKTFPCMDARCQGRVRMLTEPEGMDDGPYVRSARLCWIQGAGSYLRELPGQDRTSGELPTNPDPLKTALRQIAQEMRQEAQDVTAFDHDVPTWEVHRWADRLLLLSQGEPETTKEEDHTR